MEYGKRRERKKKQKKKPQWFQECIKYV